MLLRQIIDHLDDEEPGIYEEVTFREKDAQILKEECLKKYNSYTQMISQKHKLAERLIQLKEELCLISPEALEQIERDCSLRNDSDEEIPAKRKKTPKAPVGKNIKKNQRKKKPQKLSYS